MQGSSAFQFGARRLPGGPARPPAADRRRRRQHPVPPARRHRRRLAGAARADRGLAGGHARRRSRAARRRRARRDPAAGLSADARPRPRASGRGPARLHRDRRLPGAGRHPGAGDGARRGGRLRALRGRRRRLHRPAGRGFRLPGGQGAGDRRSWPRARGSTSPPPMPTRTPSPTCRCSRRSATRSPSTPTARWPGSPGSAAGTVLRFDRLGRRLKTAAALGASPGPGGIGGAAVVRRLRPRGRLAPRRAWSSDCAPCPVQPR